ncbi:hypothetical protein [Flavobacterium aquatile]|uniref:hypothetical protein n=1 Tax=Flavobacterium aquatile TaxID=245 RepID=UPI00103DE307|nr:hypothetical protein [Flavobacterium aquatile]
MGQNNFLSFLYSSLKKYDSTFGISVPFYNEVTSDSSHETWMYDNESIIFKTTLLSSLHSLIFCLFSNHFYKTFFFILFVEKKVGKSLHFCYQQLLAKSFFIRNNNFQEFDTFHFHFMQYSYLRELFLVPKGKKIVCTFWGSDLLRTNDILNFYFVKKALNRATIITCQSEELKEIILSKFGRNLTDKIQIVLFPVYEKIYDLMDLNYNNTEAIDLFKSSYNYSKDKINILIGHSGSPSNNHLKILNSLENLINKDKIHLIINLNYAITVNEKEAYKKELRDALNNTGCSYVILEKFFVNEELAISRLASDIFIHAPISDALSGTMLELLYASNIVITGSWLPYKTYRKANLDYFEIYDFFELSGKLNLIIENFSIEKEMVSKNKDSIRDYFISDRNIKKWSQILS